MLAARQNRKFDCSGRARAVIRGIAPAIRNFMAFGSGYRQCDVTCRGAGAREQYRQDFNTEEERRATEGHGGRFNRVRHRRNPPWPSVALRSSSVLESSFEHTGTGLACGGLA